MSGAELPPLVLGPRAMIAEGQTKGFYVEDGGRMSAIFIVRRFGKLYAYHNRCPHLGTPLEFVDDRFLTADGRYIICSTHGALFRVEDGYCLAGPCAGRSLMPATLECGDDGILRLRRNPSTP